MENLNQQQSNGRKIIAARRAGMGTGGNCICVFCGHRQPHQRNVPCDTLKCPNCGAVLVREA